MGVAVVAALAVALGVNYWWTRRRLWAERAFRTANPMTSQKWLGQLANAIHIELFAKQGETMRFMGSHSATVEATYSGLLITQHQKYKSGHDIAPLTIPWNKIHNAGDSLEQPRREGILAAPAPTRIAIAVSEQWLEDLGAKQYPIVEPISPEDQVKLYEQEADYRAHKDEYEQEYDDDMREDWGDLYQRGLEFIEFDTYFPEGLVDAIKSRATGIPEPLED